MRIVVKVGTSTLAHATGRLNIQRMERLCKVLSDLKNAGHEIILVSSGAIGMGVGKLNLSGRPADMPGKQAAAAVGQCELMYFYDKLFTEYNHIVAQLLLTGEDIRSEQRSRNVRNTLSRLLELGALPVINENDAVATDEIGVDNTIGENDSLSAIVAAAIGADLLILLSDIDGLYDSDPHRNPDARLIETVPVIDAHILSLAGDKGSALATGGMVTKLHAAQIATAAGCEMVIANGEKPEVLYDIVAGRRAGTRFLIPHSLGGTTMTTMDILRRTKAAWPSICNASAEDKNRILSAMADSLQAECDVILRCTAEDMDAARGHISDVMLDRLYLDKDRIDAMADGIRATVALPDHTGRILAQIDHPNGMKIYKKQVPLGLVAIIYESRPNVTSDAAALTIKSGNVCMLRSGKEAFRTAKAIVAALKQGIASAGGDPDIVNIVEDTSHQSATEIMQAKGLVDLLIPRGGAGLIRACVRNATVPCIETGTGICHVYVDEYADLDKAVRIIENAKTSRPSVCNAEEVCLVHRAVAARFLPMLKKALVDDRAAQGLTPVELRLDAAAAQIIDGKSASDKDFDTEYLDYILAVGVVDSLDAAIAHVLAHSTHHSDAIVTEDAASAERFINGTDSAATYVNVSTRFTDGGEFGLGCEMGISTQKLHARGPMGLDELSTYKYIIRGDGQIR